MSAYKAIATLRDFVERATHWQEGGADRDAAKRALDALDIVVDDIDWMDKGISEWRSTAIANGTQARAARATADIAIQHLIALVLGASQEAESSAKTWLASIGWDV